MGKIYHENISGIDVSFFSDESEEYTKEMINRVKEKLKGILESSQTMSTPRAAVIACLELYDELEKETNKTQELTKKLEELEKRLDKAIVDRAEAQTRAAMLKQDVLDLTIELSNLK